MRSKLENIFLIVMAVWVSGMFVYLWVKDSKLADGDSAIASVVSKKNKSYTIQYQFSVNNETYDGEEGGRDIFYQTYKDERFEVVYEKGNPKNSKILFDRPVFNSKGLLGRTVAEAFEDDEFFRSYFVFEYEVNGKKIIRRQMPGDRKMEDYLEKKYLVKYYIDNPEVGYIYLDSIVNK